MSYSRQKRRAKKKLRRARRKEKARKEKAKRAAMAPAFAHASAPTSSHASAGRAVRIEAAQGLLGFLAALPGPLYGQGDCASVLDRTAARVVAAGGEFLSVVVQSDDPSSCCGRDFLMLATVNPCLEPEACQADHLASPRQMVAIAEEAAASAPGFVKASPGWAEAIAKLSGGRPTVS